VLESMKLATHSESHCVMKHVRTHVLRGRSIGVLVVVLLALPFSACYVNALAPVDLRYDAKLEKERNVATYEYDASERQVELHTAEKSVQERMNMSWSEFKTSRNRETAVSHGVAPSVAAQVLPAVQRKYSWNLQIVMLLALGLIVLLVIYATRDLGAR